jgi:hypothetical protein
VSCAFRTDSLVAQPPRINGTPTASTKNGFKPIIARIVLSLTISLFQDGAGSRWHNYGSAFLVLCPGV